MLFLHGMTILLCYQLLGEVTVLWFKLPIPGPVMGMGYLFITLLLYGKIPAALEHTATALLSHLSLLFIPAGVGLMMYIDFIKQEWLPIILTLLLSTSLSIIVIGWLMQSLMRLTQKRTPSE